MDGIGQLQNLMNYQTQLREAQGVNLNNASALESVNEVKHETFGDYLGKAIETLNQNMNTMNEATKQMITGDQSDLGQVMIKMTEAQLSLQTAVQVRNKCLEAYNEIKNMQI